MLIYGGLGFLCVSCSGLGILAQGGDDKFGIQEVLDKEAPGNQIVTFVGAAISVVCCLTSLAAGIGVLRLVRFARIAAYVGILIDLVSTLTATVYIALILIPAHDVAFARQAENMPPGPVNVQTIMSGSMWIWLILNLLFTLAFCTAILMLLSLKSTRAAFAGEFPASPVDDRWPRKGDLDDYDDEPYAPPPKSPPDTGITDRS